VGGSVQVKIVPNYRRPGAGHLPVRPSLPSEGPTPAPRRPSFEAASESGFLVYPPLHPTEAVEVLLQDDGAFLFTLFADDAHGNETRLFSVTTGGSAGWGGLGRVVYNTSKRTSIDHQMIDQLIAAMTTNVMPGTPGQFGFLGAHNFITPEGWNTLCVSPLNDPRDDGIPSLNCLIESDWYPQNTEFRYAFKRGESIRFTHDTPLGQVLFVPREPVTLVGVSATDQAAAVPPAAASRS